MSKVFETKVVAVGPEAQGMIAGADMLILFGEGAPADLAEFCFAIDNKNLTGSIHTGGKVVIDGQEYPITAVGNVVETNLGNLGHITISFDGSTEGSLPGTLHIDAPNKVAVKEGTIVQIFD